MDTNPRATSHPDQVIHEWAGTVLTMHTRLPSLFQAFVDIDIKITQLNGRSHWRGYGITHERGAQTVVTDTRRGVPA
jgi:hypothetical protein